MGGLLHRFAPRNNISIQLPFGRGVLEDFRSLGGRGKGEGEPVAADFSLRKKKYNDKEREIGKRWWNVKDVERYCERVESLELRGQREGQEGAKETKDGIRNTEQRATEKIQNIVEGEELLDKEKLVAEAMMLGLRMIEGIDTRKFYSIHGVAIEDKYGEEIKELKKDKLLELKNGKLRLT